MAQVIQAVFASQNANKLAELRDGLPGWELAPLAAGDWPEETGETYAENALLKARFGRTFASPDEWVLGEDSGIECDALDGGPGLHSARWAKGDQADALLERIDIEIDRDKRGALWHRLQEIYMEELPVLPLYFRANPFVIPKWLTGIEPTGHSGSTTYWIENWKSR